MCSWNLSSNCAIWSFFGLSVEFGLLSVTLFRVSDLVRVFMLACLVVCNLEEDLGARLGSLLVVKSPAILFSGFLCGVWLIRIAAVAGNVCSWTVVSFKPTCTP